MTLKVLVLGATGVTGQSLVQQALERTHHVTALVRNPAKLNIQHENLTVVKCDIFNKEEMLPQVQNADVVMSTLGFSLFETPVVGYLNISKMLSECMKEAGNRRVVFMHSWYTNPESRGRAEHFFIRNIFLPYVIGVVLDGMHEAEQYLATQDHLDYTVVLPAGLGKGPQTDKKFHTSDSEWFVPECKSYIDRADVARYMLDVVDDETSFHKVRAIAVDHVSEQVPSSCSVS